LITRKGNNSQSQDGNDFQRIQSRLAAGLESNHIKLTTEASQSLIGLTRFLN